MPATNAFVPGKGFVSTLEGGEISHTYQAVVILDPATGLPVAPGGGDGGAVAADREVVVTQYRVKTAFTGASIGDTISQIRVLDVSGESITQVGATIWYNETTAAALASAPSSANYEPLATGGLTNAQFVAGLSTIATAALQTTGNTALTGMSAKLPATLGIKTSALSLSVAPASDANLSRETYSAVTIMAQSTHATTGATPVAFTTQACSALDLVNNTGYDIEYQRAAAGLYLRVPTGTSRLVQGITNASQVGIRRVDQVATPVSVQAEAFAV